MLIRGLLAETAKERMEKHPPPENCKWQWWTKKSGTCCPEEAELWIWLSSRFRNPCYKEYRPWPNWRANWWDINDGKTPDTRHVLDHVMDSVAMLGNTNWKLNMKQRELIKPELNPPYTRLCKEDITLSTKLFGDDLAKHLKDMSEAKKAGQQMQKPYPNSSNRGAVHSQKRNFSRFKPYHYDRTRGSGNKSTNRQPFLGQGRPSAPFRKKHPASINNKN